MYNFRGTIARAVLASIPIIGTRRYNTYHTEDIEPFYNHGSKRFCNFYDDRYIINFILKYFYNDSYEFNVKTQSVKTNNVSYFKIVIDSYVDEPITQDVSYVQIEEDEGGDFDKYPDDTGNYIWEQGNEDGYIEGLDSENYLEFYNL